MNTNLWKNYSGENRKPLEDFCNGYKQYISDCKTERECIAKAIEIAKQNGYTNLEDAIKQNKRLAFGDKVYAVNMDKSLILFCIGEQPLESGMNIVGSHVDSPRLDLKAKPIYENNGLCLLDTHYYGGIKKYQWTAIPLAIHGTVVKKDGTKKHFVVGENENDPVVGISDLLPHLEKNKKDPTDIKGEDLNVLVGSIPFAQDEKEKDQVKKNIVELLKTQGIEEQDLFSAEFEIVPAGNARDFGLDKSMIIGYGQDDRVCAYTSLMALLETQAPQKTACCIMVDKEEIGSVGATGMCSKFFENTVAEVLNLAGEYSELKLRRCLTNSKMLSSDVTAAFDPNYPTPSNAETDAHFAKGISFNKYTGSRGKYDANDANPEFIASLRNILDENNVCYQATEMGKVDAGGGGTIAYIMANYGMNVIDAGVPLLSMHAPWEISCKTDVYESYRAYKAFYTMQ